MNKKLILSCLLGAAAFSAVAVETTVTYTYADDQLSGWGKGKSEIYDVAIRITDPALVGKKITGIRALLNADEGVESTSLWLSKELKLEKIDGVKLNVPDTYSVDVAVEKTTIPGMEGSFGQLSATLDVPYVLTDEGIYVGYTLTVPAAPEGGELTPEQKQPLLFSKSDNRESLYLRPSKDFVNWTASNANLGYAAAIYVSIEGEFDEYSVSINSLDSKLVKIDEDFEVTASVSNYGINAVTQIGYSYSLAGKQFENTLDFETPLESNLVTVSSREVNLPIVAVDELGDYTLDLKITSVNGKENVNMLSSATSDIKVLPFVPVHRPMVEEFTGTWCGWCPRGYIAFEEMNKIYGDDVVLAAYHNGDPMAVKSYPVTFGGAPRAILNRGPLEDPYQGLSTSKKEFGMKTEVYESMNTPVAAAIDVDAFWSDDVKTFMFVNAEARFLEDKADAGYKIGFLLINNGLTGQGSNWMQENYFANYPGSYNGCELEVLTTWPSMVEGLVFNDVVVDVTGMMGVEGSVPTNVEYNTPYKTMFTYDISRNKIIQDIDQLYVVAFIINPDGTILNANKTRVSDPSAVGSIDSDVHEVSTEYYNLSGSRVSNPQDGIFVKVSHLSDGSTRTFKIAR